VAQEDSSVIVHDDGTVAVHKDGTASANAQAQVEATVPEVPQEPAIVTKSKNVRDFFCWASQKLMDACLKDESDKSVQKKLFAHMTNHTAQTMWDANENQPLEPSSCSDARMSDDQKTLSCPSYKNALVGFISHDVKGK